MMAAYGNSRLWLCTLLQTAAFSFSLHRFFLSTKTHFLSIAVDPRSQPGLRTDQSRLGKGKDAAGFYYGFSLRCDISDKLGCVGRLAAVYR